MEVDGWSLGGAVMGVNAALLASSKGWLKHTVRWKQVIGGAGVGSILGIVGYMIWRHGIKKGIFDMETTLVPRSSV